MSTATDTGPAVAGPASGERPDVAGPASARPASWLLGLRCLVVACVIALVTNRWAFWNPDSLFVLAAVVCSVFGQFRTFVRHFLPFVGLLWVYASFRSIADDLNEHVHFTEMIAVDRWLGGGTLPTEWLQRFLWHGRLQWYDFYFYVTYAVHYIVPALLAFFLWKRRPKLYWQFVATFVVLSFAAFLTYLAFPAAPPWMASQQGHIPPIQWISMDIWDSAGITRAVSVYNALSPNQVAAVPSLHASYPMLTLIFLARSFGWRRVWWVGCYPLSVWVAIVYLGEHYVFDILAGVLYTALIAFAVPRILGRPAAVRAARSRRGQPERVEDLAEARVGAPADG